MKQQTSQIISDEIKVMEMQNYQKNNDQAMMNNGLAPNPYNVNSGNSYKNNLTPNPYNANSVNNNNNGLAPNPLNIIPTSPLNFNQQLDPHAEMKIDGAISDAFGPFFFNLRDPSFTKTNDPIHKDSEWYIAALICSIIFFAGLIIGVIGFNKFLNLSQTLGIILGAYVLYFIVSLALSQIRSYIANMKVYQDFAHTYEIQRKGVPFFKFYIQCYHYTTVYRKGRSQRRKVVTHTASQTLNVMDYVDQSGELNSIRDVKPCIFIHYIKRYYFADDASQSKFLAAYNNFVQRNRRDSYQSHSNSFEIQGFEQYASFTQSSPKCLSNTLFYFFLIIGLIYPYSMIFERRIGRYEIGILKRVRL